MTRRWQAMRGAAAGRGGEHGSVGPVHGGRGWVRRSTATSWRSARSSMSLVEEERAISRSSPSICQKIKYSNRSDTRDHADRLQDHPGHRPRPGFWSPAIPGSAALERVASAPPCRRDCRRTVADPGARQPRCGERPGLNLRQCWDRPRRPTQRPGGAAVVGTAELDAPSGPALRDARDVADGSAVGVALSVLVTEGFVVAVGSSVGMGDASAGARSSTRPTDVPVSPLISVDPFSSSSPVTTIRPSTKTMAVAPIQRRHGRRGGSSGEVVPPAPIRRVGAASRADRCGRRVRRSESGARGISRPQQLRRLVALRSPGRRDPRHLHGDLGRGGGRATPRPQRRHRVLGAVERVLVQRGRHRARDRPDGRTGHRAQGAEERSEHGAGRGGASAGDHLVDREVDLASRLFRALRASGGSATG